MKQGHVFLKKLPKQILQYAILLLGAFCALVPIVSCVTTAFKETLNKSTVEKANR